MADKLSEDKITELKDVYDLFDKNRNSYISHNDLKGLMIALGADPTDDEMSQIISEADPNNTGMITFEQFLDIYAVRAKEPNSEEDLIEAFKIFDSDGSGTISADELRTVMMTLGEKLSREEAEAMIKEADVDGDGNINYKEFVNTLVSKA
jgi:calmodulin